MTKAQRTWKLIKTAATRAGEVLVEEAPALLAIRRDTPFPVLALAAFRVWRCFAEKTQRGDPPHWSCGAWHIQRAIIEAALQLHLPRATDRVAHLQEEPDHRHDVLRHLVKVTLADGDRMRREQIGEELADRGDGIRRRRVGRCSFGLGGGTISLPTGGRIEDFLVAFWSATGGCVVASTDGEHIALIPARAACPEPSARVREIASDCAKLRAAGHRVGLLLDGQPGSGKSEALRYVAAQLGGRVLRMTLGENGTAAAEFVRHLRPDAVIIDDIDLHHEFGACEPDLLEALAAHLDPPERARLIGHTVATVVRHNEIAATLGKAKAAAFVESVALSEATSAGDEPGPAEA